MSTSSIEASKSVSTPSIEATDSVSTPSLEATDSVSTPSLEATNPLSTPSRQTSISSSQSSSISKTEIGKFILSSYKILVYKKKYSPV